MIFTAHKLAPRSCQFNNLFMVHDAKNIEDFSKYSSEARSATVASSSKAKRHQVEIKIAGYSIDLLHKTGWVTSTLTPDSTDTPRFSRLHILVYFTQNDPKLAYLAMFALAVLQL